MRQEELTETINEALAFAMSNLHTIAVCRVTQVNEKTINCQPVINRVVNGQSVQITTFREVPPVFMSGGSSYESYPIAVGDYCLLLLSERCYDAWYKGTDFVSPLEMRMHDYSDGFALVGIQNEAGAITIPDVITKIGDMFAQGNWEHVGNVTRTGNTNQTGFVDVSQYVRAPILRGVLQGYDGGNMSTGVEITAAKLHANDGWSGTFPVHDGRTVTVVDGIITDVS